MYVFIPAVGEFGKMVSVEHSKIFFTLLGFPPD